MYNATTGLIYRNSLRMALAGNENCSAILTVGKNKKKQSFFPHLFLLVDKMMKTFSVEDAPHKITKLHCRVKKKKIFFHLSLI